MGTGPDPQSQQTHDNTNFDSLVINQRNRRREQARQRPALDDVVSYAPMQFISQTDERSIFRVRVKAAVIKENVVICTAPFRSLVHEYEHTLPAGSTVHPARKFSVLRFRSLPRTSPQKKKTSKLCPLDNSAAI